MLSSFGNKKSEKDGVVGEPMRAAAAPMAAGGPPPLAARPAVSTRPGDRAPASVIGPDLTIVGNLVSRGEVQIDGEVQGDIHGTNIVIGERGCIEITIGGRAIDQRIGILRFQFNDPVKIVDRREIASRGHGGEAALKQRDGIVRGQLEGRA